MSPRYKIMREILLLSGKDIPDLDLSMLDTEEQVEDNYELLIGLDYHWDYESEFRKGQIETNIPAPRSVYYSSKSVAARMTDGSWVGWTYFYGGSKHGDPREMGWMEDAYELDCVEEEKLVLVRTFTIHEDTPK